MDRNRSGSASERKLAQPLLKERLELTKVKGRDGRVRTTLKPIEDTLTFEKGFYVFIRAIQLLRGANEGVILVGLAGASGSGKTAFSQKVREFMPGIAVISMDNYNDASKVIDSNYDDPRLTDYDTLLSNLSDLRAGNAVEVPVYDFKLSARTGYTHLEVPTSRVVMVEGIFALSERLRPLLDLRVSITGGVHFDLVKRVLRDLSRSGQGPEEIIQQITDTVFPMYKVTQGDAGVSLEARAFIEPDLQTAQLRIHNAFNPFSGFQAPTYILKAARTPGLDEGRVAAALGGDVRLKLDADIYDIFLLPPNEDVETCQSLLRMRNREGRYTLMFEEWVGEGNFIISPRITFEVSVRVLGGLMSLGYTIGSIMKRTSRLWTSDATGVTVKFDDVEHLGAYVQVQGREREAVAKVAAALGLESFIPKPYIEQVQLGRLVADFQGVSEEVRKRFSMGGCADGAFDDLTPASSPRPGTHAHAWRASRAASAQAAMSAAEAGLSTSAPSGSAPITIPHPHVGDLAGGGGGASRAGGRLVGGAARSAGGGGGGGGMEAGPRGSGGGVGSSGRSPFAPSPVEEGGAGVGDRPGSGAQVAAIAPTPRGLLGQQLRAVGDAAGAAPALQEPGRARTPGAHDGASHVDLSAGGRGGVPPAVAEQLRVLAEQASRYSGLQLQMDAMLHQYREMLEAIKALTAATQQLHKELPQRVQAAGGAGLLTAPPTWAAAAPLAALGLGCVALGAAVGVAVTRR